MKTKLMMIALVFSLVVFGGSYALAATGNTQDTKWNFVSKDGVGYTTYRAKNLSGNVYCYPKVGDPKVYVTVGGAKDTNGTGKSACSKKVLLSRGTQYTIVNSVKEKYSYARLRFDTHTYTGATNSGVWSPDAKKDYTVVGR